MYSSVIGVENGESVLILSEGRGGEGSVCTEMTSWDIGYKTM